MTEKKQPSQTLTGHVRGFPKSYGHENKIARRIFWCSIRPTAQNEAVYGQNDELWRKYKKIEKFWKIDFFFFCSDGPGDSKF